MFLTISKEEQLKITEPFRNTEAVRKYRWLLTQPNVKTDDMSSFCEYNGHHLAIFTDSVRYVLRLPKTATKESCITRKISLQRFFAKNPVS